MIPNCNFCFSSFWGRGDWNSKLVIGWPVTETQYKPRWLAGRWLCKRNASLWDENNAGTFCLNVWRCELKSEYSLNNRRNNRIDVFSPSFFPNKDEDGCFICLYPPYAALNACQKRWISLSQPNTPKHYIIYIKIIPKISVSIFFKVDLFFFFRIFEYQTELWLTCVLRFIILCCTETGISKDQNNANNGSQICIYVLNVIVFPLNVETSYITKL